MTETHQNLEVRATN